MVVSEFLVSTETRSETLQLPFIWKKKEWIRDPCACVLIQSVHLGMEEGCLCLLFFQIRN